MKVYGELIRASLEILTADPSAGVAGRVWFNSSSNDCAFEDGTNVYRIYDSRHTLTPAATGTYDIGVTGTRFRDLFLSRNADIGGTLGVTGAVTLSSSLSVEGNTTLGNTAADTITFTGSVASHIVNSVTNTYDLGTSSILFRAAYATQVLGAATGVAITFVGQSSTGFGYAATNRIRAYSNGTSVLDIFDSSGPNILIRTASAGSGLVYQNVSDGLLNISGSSGNASGRNIQLYGSTHATKAGFLEVRRDSTVDLNINNSGEVWISGKFGNSGAVGSNAMLKLNGNTLTGVTQVNIDASTFSITSAATTQAYGFLSGATTANSSFTLPTLAQFYAQNISKGASSTITRRIGFLVDAPTGGTNNAHIADGVAFTGDWFINQAGSAASKLGGALTVVGGIVGTTTNDNAASGNVGQALRASVSTATSLATSNTWQDFTSIDLAAGDWDVTLVASFLLNGSTTQACNIAISTQSGNTTSDHVDGDNSVGCATPTSTARSSATIANFRKSVASSTTIYAKGMSTFTVGNPQMVCRISARRVR